MNEKLRIHESCSREKWSIVYGKICGFSLYQCVLQCVAVCCSVLQCVAVCCSVLQCVALCCISQAAPRWLLPISMCAAVCCSVLQCVAVCCSVLQCVALWCISQVATKTSGTRGEWGTLYLRICAVIFACRKDSSCPLQMSHFHGVYCVEELCIVLKNGVYCVLCWRVGCIVYCVEEWGVLCRIMGCIVYVNNGVLHGKT